MIEEIFLVFRRFFSLHLQSQKFPTRGSCGTASHSSYMLGSGYGTETLESRSPSPVPDPETCDSESRDLVPDSETLPK